MSFSYIIQPYLCQGYRNHVNFTIGPTADGSTEVRCARMRISPRHSTLLSTLLIHPVSRVQQVGYLMGRFAGALTVSQLKTPNRLLFLQTECPSSLTPTACLLLLLLLLELLGALSCSSEPRAC